LLHDKEEKILFQQRSNSKRYPNKWVISAGGHIPSGNDILKQAHSELQEELGFDTEIFFLQKEFKGNEYESRFIYWFVAQYDGQKITTSLNEVQNTKFISRETMEKIFEDFDPASHKESFFKDFSVIAYQISKYYWNKI
jgi:isopentenyldiphosphate isomerase